MTEYIVNVPDEAAEYFIAKFGLDDVTMLGYHLTGEVVRCRDCKHCYEQLDGYECERFSGEYHRAELDGFCAWAERKEVGE